MKKSKSVARKAKPSVALEHRLTRLEDGMKEFRTDIGEIKEQIKINIIEAIQKTNSDLKTLLERKQNYDAIRVFLTRCLQFSVSVASLTWVVIQIIKLARGWNL